MTIAAPPASLARILAAGGAGFIDSNLAHQPAGVEDELTWPTVQRGGKITHLRVAHFVIRGMEGRAIKIYGDGCQRRFRLWKAEILDLLGKAGCVSIKAGVEGLTVDWREALAKNCRFIDIQDPRPLLPSELDAECCHGR